MGLRVGIFVTRLRRHCAVMGRGVAFGLRGWEGLRHDFQGGSGQRAWGSRSFHARGIAEIRVSTPAKRNEKALESIVVSIQSETSKDWSIRVSLLSTAARTPAEGRLSAAARSWRTGPWPGPWPRRTVPAAFGGHGLRPRPAAPARFRRRSPGHPGGAA